MIKNMTRKGLALGSTAALVVAGLVGISAPAQAAGIVLEPTVGDSYSVPLDAAFTLNTYFATGDNGYNDEFDVVVVDADGGLASVAISSGNTDSSANTDDEFEVNVSGPPTAGDEYTVTLTPDAATTETFSVTVVSSFARGGSSATRTVTFHHEDDYDWVLTFDKPYVGDAAFVASVTTSPAINLAQIDSVLEIGFATVASNAALTAATADTTVSSDVKRLSAGTNGDDATDADVSTDGSSIDFEVAASSTVAAASYVAQILYNSEQVGTRAVAVVGAATIEEVDAPELTETANVSGTDIREGTSSVEVSAQVYAEYTSAGHVDNVVADAGETVDVVISIDNGGSSTIDADASITAGGETLDADTTDLEITFEAVTDADGVVSFNVALGDLVDTDTFNVAVSAQGFSADDDFTVVETAAAALYDFNLAGTSAAWKVVDGTYTVKFAAVDNFGQPLAGSDYRVVLANGVDADAQAKSLANGVASFSVSTTDSEDAEVSAFTATLQAASGLNWATAKTYGGVNISTVNLTPTIGASNAADKIAVSTTDGALNLAGKYTTASGDEYALALEDLAAGDERIGGIVTAGTLGTTLSGTLTDVAGIQTYGSVTISGADLMFGVPTNAGTAMVYSLGSATVQTSTAGAFAGVEVYSNIAGKHAVTVTSGSASQVVYLVFDAADEATGTSLVIDAPSVVAAGSTVMATATLTDEYGNPVKTTTGTYFDVAYDGPGFSVVVPSAYDADGKAKLAYFLGSADTGTITITYSYSPVGNADFDGDDDLVVQKTIYIGSAPSEALASWTSNQNDGTVKMYAKNIVGAGKVQFMLNGEEIAWVRAATTADPKLRLAGAEGAAYLVRTVDLVEGQKNALEIYVDGVRITRSAYTY